jgi:Domain of unknown function (DUF1707)
VVAGPGDQMADGAAGRRRMRASHADREQVIEALKVAFVHGRLTKDELDTRAGQALSAQTRADLAAVSADIPAGAGPVRLPGPARRRPLARAAAGSGGCLIIAAAAVWAAFILDPGPPAPTPYHSWAKPFFFLAIAAILTALSILVVGVATSVHQGRSRTQLPTQRGPGGHAKEAERCGGTGHGPVHPGPRTDQTCADLRSHWPGWGRRHTSGRGAEAPHGTRPVPGAVWQVTCVP